jgi:hypothetical protein
MVGLILVILLLLNAVLITCESATELSEEEKVRTYADLETKAIVKEVSENDLVKYTQYGNDDFIAVASHEILDASVTRVNDQLGAHEL